MAAKFRGQKLVLATHNKGKLREIEELLASFSIQVIGAGALGLPEPEETGTTFEENAALKARAAAHASGLPALADDSGLVVAALDGAPGVYSARWAGPTKDFDLAMRLVEDRLDGDDDRNAYFVAVLALAWPDGRMETFRGEAHGTLIWPPRGDRGFGYDPMFLPHGSNLTFGEMEPAAKHMISHRAAAFEKFRIACLAP